MIQRSLSFILVALILGSCGNNREDPADRKNFPLRGMVVEVDTVKHRITIAHQEIPDYMMEMAMPFKVHDRNLLRDVLTGDSVAATLSVSQVESWLSTLTVIGTGEAPGMPADPMLGQMLRPGDDLPDLVFVNQDGQRVRLTMFTGEVVALTFIYTRCPLPDFCIRMSDYFSKIQRSLLRKGKQSGWHLLTISFDPVFDRPSVLRGYGETYGADFSRWTFLTDPDTAGGTVLRLADGFGLGYQDDEDNLIAHNLRTALFDREGKLVEIIRDNDWSPEEVAGRMESLLD